MPRRNLKKLRRDPGGAAPPPRPRQAPRDLVPEPAPAKAGDEARIGQQGTLTRVWAKRGTRPRAPRDRRYEWAYIFGAVCPRRRATAALVVPTANAEVMSLHLAEIARQIAPGAHAALVLDGAGYHVANALAVPDNVTLVPLPPYAPELNPMENVWEYLRGNKLAITVFDDYDDSRRRFAGRRRRGDCRAFDEVRILWSLSEAPRS